MQGTHGGMMGGSTEGTQGGMMGDSTEATRDTEVEAKAEVEADDV